MEIAVQNETRKKKQEIIIIMEQRQRRADHCRICLTITIAFCSCFFPAFNFFVSTNARFEAQKVVFNDIARFILHDSHNK